MRLLATLAATAVAAFSIPLAPTASYAAGETCRGLPATIVGTAGQNVSGTDGPDVIVTAGAVRVEAKGGDDTICTTLSPPSPQLTLLSVTVLAGPGNDYVDRSGDTDPAAVGLVSGDAGQDTIIGAPGQDLVNTNDGEHDVVSTGAGNDSGTDGGDPGSSADPDSIDLGPGNDQWNSEAPYSPGENVIGGEGLDVLSWTLAHQGAFTVDAAAGQFRGPHGLVSVFTGFEAYSAFSPRHAIWSFLGADEAELVQGSTRDLRSAALGGGDDRLILSTGGRRINVPVDEGAGHDRFELQAKHEARQIVVDLRRSRYAIEDGPRGRLHGVEDAYVNGNDVRLLGTYGADTLGVVACTAGLIDAGGGDDVATMFVRPGRFCDHTVPRILGGPGNDVLTGSRVHDLVIGGPGDDTANGLGGRDTCRSVESATRCERR